MMHCTRLLPLLLAAACATRAPVVPVVPDVPEVPEAVEVALAPWPSDEGIGTLSNDGTYWVTYLPPGEGLPLNADFELTVRVFDAETRSHAVDGIEVVVDARMPAHFHGLKSAAEVTPASDGSFAVNGMLLHMAGHWELYVDITRGPLTERAQFDIELE